MGDLFSQNLSITAGPIGGIGYAPLWVNGKMLWFVHVTMADALYSRCVSLN